MSTQSFSDYLTPLEEKQKYIHPELHNALQLAVLRRLLAKLATLPVDSETEKKLDDILQQMHPDRLQHQSHLVMLSV